jgi:hypothetical protein
VVLDQLETTCQVASMYRDNPFPLRMLLVVMSVVKLLSRIVVADIGEEAGKMYRHFMITPTVSRPTPDAVRLCFLGTHSDADHTGVPNTAQRRTPLLPRSTRCRRAELGRPVLGPLNGQQL